MIERFLCDVIYFAEHRIDIIEVLCTDIGEALEWMDAHFVELHLENDERPDAIRLRRPDSDDIITTYETHFDVVR